MATGKTIRTGITFDLLWTNASPESNFAAQTISLDLSDYDAVMVEYLGANDSALKLPAILMMGTSGVPAQKGSASGAVLGRRTSVSVSGCTFAAGYVDASENNKYAIPTRIWGIKGIQS